MIREFTFGEAMFLVAAVRWTVLLAALAFIGGSVVGLIFAVLRVRKGKLPRAAAIVYIKLFQGTPLLMQLYLVYFGANLLGLQADAWLAAALGLTLYTSAFLAEIWRGCIQAIPRGQWDGARAMALSPLLQLRLVILPQALRIVELTRAAQMVNNATFRPFIVYGLVAALYFMLCWPLSAYSRRLEQRLGQQAGQRPGRVALTPAKLAAQ